jgi:pimeloyl-ACP methyl ester carboxylesterase
MAEYIPGRHLAYWDAWDAPGLKAAYELMDETIAEQGPFDGVIAYSQGGAFALGYLLQMLIDDPNAVMPFKFAVFHGTAAALSSDPEYNTAEIMRSLGKLTDEEAEELHVGFVSRKGHRDPREMPVAKDGRLSGQDLELFCELLDMVKASLGARNFFGIEESDERMAVNEDEVYSLKDFPRFFNAVYTPQRIPIPTVHIRGLHDDVAPLRLAEIAQELCEPSMTQLIRYDGVHEVVHKADDVARVRAAVEKAYMMGQMNATHMPKAMATQPTMVAA